MGSQGFQALNRSPHSQGRPAGVDLDQRSSPHVRQPFSIAKTAWAGEMNSLRAPPLATGGWRQGRHIRVLADLRRLERGAAAKRQEGDHEAWNKGGSEQPQARAESATAWRDRERPPVSFQSG